MNMVSNDNCDNKLNKKIMKIQEFQSNFGTTNTKTMNLQV